jgi:hypothetical protein
MNPKIEITSLSITKLNNEQNGFVKYNIESAMDEIENTETEVKLKYKFILLSNPTNTKLSIEGIATIYGDQTEISKHFSPDEKNIPHVVNNIYQEIFPLFYIISKSMQIPCPAYRLSQISASQRLESEVKPEPVNDKAEPAIESEIIPPTNSSENPMPQEIEIEPNSIQEQIIEEPRM